MFDNINRGMDVYWHVFINHRGSSILLLFYWHFLVFETHLLLQFWSEGLEIHNTVGQLSKAPQEGKNFQIKPLEPAPGSKRCHQ